MQPHIENRPGLANCYHFGMRSKEIRLKNLRTLVSRFDTVEEFSNAAGVDAGYIRQILGGFRGLGPKTVNTIESNMDLGEGWMDQIDRFELDKTVLTEIMAQLKQFQNRGFNLTPEGMAEIIAANYTKEAVAGEKINLEPSIRLVVSNQ